MTTKQIIEDITSWVRENICEKIELKLPDDDKVDGCYELQMVKPAAFPLFVPAKDRMPPNVPAPVPSIAVQMMEGKDNLKKSERRIRIRLCLSAWNPGIHQGEKLSPIREESVFGGYTYKKGGISEEQYERNSDGWKDLYNFQDIALSELEGAEFFAGVRIDMEEPITYGPFTEDGVIWDYYPYWNGWIAFTVICGVPYKKSKEIYDLLN